jgi:hypothetical protein
MSEPVLTKTEWEAILAIDTPSSDNVNLAIVAAIDRHFQQEDPDEGTD